MALLAFHGELVAHMRFDPCHPYIDRPLTEEVGHGHVRCESADSATTSSCFWPIPKWRELSIPGGIGVVGTWR